MGSLLRPLRETADWAGMAAFAVITLLIAARITNGIDLSDEAYYAIFLDDWLKGGIGTSTFVTLHQTAALIVYPAALVYSTLNGSSDGLFLFLRILFLIGTIISAAFWTLCLFRLHNHAAAWAGGVLVLAFIPFGLPAPSYNTLGLQALICALASFGCAALAVPRSREQFWWILASVTAWAVATVAYPSLVVPLAFLCLLGLLHGQQRFPRPWFYLTLLGVALSVAWAVVVASLSFQRLYDSATYHYVITDTAGLGRKLGFALGILQGHSFFAILCVAALVIGVFRQRMGAFLTALASAAVIASLFLSPPALFARSHDAITLATLFGIGLLSGLRPGAGAVDRAIALVYATSLVAALTASASAYNSVVNFCIGAVPAAGVALVGRPSSGRANWIGALPTACAIATVLSTSLFFYYGEMPGRPIPARERIHDGFFAGIAAHPDDSTLLRLMRDEVNPILLTAGGTAAVIGRIPGIILASPARLTMPLAFPLMPTISQEGLARTRSFYEHSKAQPQVVLVYRDQYFEPVNPLRLTSEDWTPVADFKTPLGHLGVYRRRRSSAPTGDALRMLLHEDDEQRRQSHERASSQPLVRTRPEHRPARHQPLIRCLAVQNERTA